jgi:phage tail-like protein
MIKLVSPPPVPAKPWAAYSFPSIATAAYSPKAGLIKGASLAATPGVRGIFGSRIVKILGPLNPLHAPQPGVASAGATTARRPFDPFTDHDFQIVIDGIEVGAFQKFDGLSWDCDVIEYCDSMDPHVRKRKGIHRFGNIKLTKGMVQNTALAEWCERVAAGEVDLRNGAIHVLDRTNDKEKPVMTFEFFQAFPVKWSSFRADGKGSATLLEEIELAVDYFNYKK